MLTSNSQPIKYRDTLKFDCWVKYFSDRTNKETFGNATKSAMKAYKTDNYSMAGVIGHQNIKKYKSLSLMVMDMEGYGFAELMKLGFEKVKQGKYEDWDKFMVRLGYFEPEKNLTAIQNNFDFSTLGAQILESRKARGLPPV